MGNTPSQSNPDPAADVEQLSGAAAPELFSRIADRGLVRLSNRDAAAEILASEYRIAVVIPGADVSPTWAGKCVRPPFPRVWIEYQHLEMLCGAHITEIGSDVFNIRFVTCSKRGRAKARLWPGPEIAELAADGRLERRKLAISDGRNSTGEYARETRDTLEGVFNSVYPRLALVNEIRNASGAGARPGEVLDAEPHEMGTVVLVWGDDDAAGAGSPLGSPRHGPAGHPVRGHQRRLGEGRTTWIRPYVTGGGSGADPAKPRVYKVRRRD